ncbi:hypothetical protein DXG03_005075 [Asterophora parasitica]|uniref:F-box domain-containing protein n=1 Tax=Asterophora parasitica TaxID=117018 RepID=A0A9P7K8U2_9AGAR|nr:hypothetical protein DXG03_005075 [Asterophora parasitica]
MPPRIPGRSQTKKKRNIDLVEPQNSYDASVKRKRCGPSLAPPSVPLNSRGLPALPTELLLNIISFTPSLPIPATRKDLCEDYSDRAKSLYVLSRVCQCLRSVFLPIAWERIDVFVTLGTDGIFCKRWNRQLAKELVRQLEIVTVRNPTLATYVK